MIRVGILGRGLAGTHFHAPLIGATAGLELVAIAGRSDVRAIIGDPSIDLIVVATPDFTHFELAMEAIGSGKHVVVDKPFVTSVEDGKRLIDVAAARHRLLVPFHNRRWDGDFLTVRDVLESGRLGDVHLFEAYWDRFRPDVPNSWRETDVAGAGTLWNLGPHLIDQMIALFGSPGLLSADVTIQRRGARVPDYFSLTFGLGSTRMILGASNLMVDARPRFAIHGTKASFVKRGLDAQEDHLRTGISPASTTFGENACNLDGLLVHASGEREKMRTRRGEYRLFYEGVAAAISSTGRAPVDPADALTGIGFIETAMSTVRP